MVEKNQQVEQQPVFQIQRIYLKDLSLEQPNSPAIFLEQDVPAIEVSVDVGAKTLADGLFESTVTITVTSKIKDKVAFLVEGKQAGIFEIHHIPAEQLDPLLGIGCPNIIYPYLRANIADVITRAGFLPIHLAEINFEVFYQQRLQALAKQQTSSTQQTNGTLVNGTDTVN
ncbi:MAG: protein-export chaperone SecB [Herbaspirillum sp.]